MMSMSNLIKQIMRDESGNELILKLKKFVKECSYLCHADTIKRVVSYIECDCDNKSTVEQLGDTDTEPLTTSIWYANCKLKELLGSTILDRIRNGDELAAEIIDFALSYPEDLLFSQADNAIPSYQYRRFDIQDCVPEIKFLKTYSYPTFERRLKSLDKNKLAFVGHLLQSPSDSDMDLSLKLKKMFNYVD